MVAAFISMCSLIPSESKLPFPGVDSGLLPNVLGSYKPNGLVNYGGLVLRN